MLIHAENQDGVEVLRFEGAFDRADMAPLEAHITRISDSGIVRVVVNMARASVVNSRAFGSLLIAQKDLNAQGGDLVVAELKGLAASVFKTLGMNRKIQSFALESEAVSHLRASAQ